MLTDKIQLTGVTSNEPEDILSSALAVIFPDDITNQHGDSSCSVIYKSGRHGEILLTLANPKSEDTKLFSHFVWNAAVQLAVLIEEGDDEWQVQGLRVLELGAGTGLAGIVAGLTGALTTVITDYPAPEVLVNIRENVARAVRLKPALKMAVDGHTWGALDEPIALAHKEKFDRILVCDCLWMPWQHANLQASITWFLAAGGRAWVVAGFHTGREKMRGFYQEKALREHKLVIEKIWEKNADGTEREWVEDRGVEDVTERKRWLVIAILRKE
ncbi:hypothetical protein K3495_g6253 [Podosphaera aphanis]|nr:hypothetical protein K3495_g6253 [Podosphaera aphanis]